MLRPTLALALTACSLLSTGCFTAAKQAYYGVTGASGKFYELEVIDGDRLATYRSFTIEPFDNSLGPHLPGDVLAAINAQLSQRLADSKLFYPDGKALKITGTVTHYTGKSGLQGSVGSLLGGQECVCRVQLRDAETGEIIGEAMCWATVKSAVRQGPGEFANGLGKGIAKWVSKRLPEEELAKRQEELAAMKE